MVAAPGLWFNDDMRRPARPPRPRRPAPPTGTVRTLFEISAGGIVHRRVGGELELCLIATKGGTRWQLPKGKQERGETLAQTAAREVAEETGIVADVGPQVDKIELWFMGTEDGAPVRHHKLVYLFLLEYRGGSTQDHDQEVDEARWFPAREARDRLTFPSERKALDRALALLAEPDRDGALAERGAH
jgi:bis(5'-nucleosidyl)-tetraphosphatase